MTHTVDPDTLVRRLPERDLQTNVVEMARWLGWLTYHAFDSRRSQPGLPDIIAIRNQTVLWIELKKDDRARLRPEQQVWSERLLAAGQDYRKWTWTSWLSGEIERTLKED
jgi:hypothetical protein